MKIFSICIPVFNEEDFIKKCLEACINLNYPKNKYEIIVVDNNSTDNTINIVSEFKNVKIIRETKQGISFARQKGLEESEGKYYVSIDADTILPPNWLNKAESIIDKNKNFTCVFGPVKIHDNPNPFFTNSVHLSTKILGLTEKHIYNCNAVYNSNILKEINGFNHAHPNFDDSVMTVILKKKKLNIIFNLSLVASISCRRYYGLKALSIFKNLSVYYKYRSRNK